MKGARSKTVKTFFADFLTAETCNQLHVLLFIVVVTMLFMVVFVHLYSIWIWMDIKKKVAILENKSGSLVQV